jgi:hypothetical protein
MKSLAIGIGVVFVFLAAAGVLTRTDNSAAAGTETAAGSGADGYLAHSAGGALGMVLAEYSSDDHGYSDDSGRDRRSHHRSGVCAPGRVWVRGHHNRHGVWVAGHYRHVRWIAGYHNRYGKWVPAHCG